MISFTLLDMRPMVIASPPSHAHNNEVPVAPWILHRDYWILYDVYSPSGWRTDFTSGRIGMEHQSDTHDSKFNLVTTALDFVHESDRDVPLTAIRGFLDGICRIVGTVLKLERTFDTWRSI